MTDLKVLHTSDWHLGHKLHGISREHEHNRFLNWLLEQMQQHAVDALIVAGDIFDTTNPSAVAMARLYHFLVDTKRALPDINIILIGGNHDSAARLEAPDPILEALNIKMVGQITRSVDGELDADRLVTPLTNASGEIAAWCAAVPFLRSFDLMPQQQDAGDVLVEGVRQLYADVFAELDSRCENGQACIATGHMYMVNSQISELSERKILGGNQHALPANIFPAEIDYIALGHMHLAQLIGNDKRICYSGSPIPLSMSEAHYPHQVKLLEFEKGKLAHSQALKIPRAVEMIAVPGLQPDTLENIIAELHALELNEQLDEADWPFLEVRVLFEKPEPGARKQIESALEGKAVRLLKITPYYPGDGKALGDAIPEEKLTDLKPEQVFKQCYQRLHDEAVPEELLECFSEILEQVQGEKRV